MKWRKITTLLAIWCLLVIVPAVIAARLLQLNRLTPNSHMGWIATIWIVGYVAQFVLFIVIGRKSPCRTGPGKLVAAFVPWLADWTAPVSLWLVLPAAIIVTGYSIWLSLSVHRLDILRRDGVTATGLVLEVVTPALNVVVDRDHVRRAIRLQVDRQDGTSRYEAGMNCVVALGEIPEPGDILAVRIHPSRPQHIEMIAGEPVLRAPANVLDVDPATADQLRRLRTMRDRGDLTEEEFASAKKQLLG